MVSVDDTMFSLCTEDHQTDDDCREHGGGQGETGWVQGGAGIWDTGISLTAAQWGDSRATAVGWAPLSLLSVL